jgi:hypothetical protein
MNLENSVTNPSRPFDDHSTVQPGLTSNANNHHTTSKHGQLNFAVGSATTDLSRAPNNDDSASSQSTSNARHTALPNLSFGLQSGDWVGASCLPKSKGLLTKESVARNVKLRHVQPQCQSLQPIWLSHSSTDTLYGCTAHHDPFFMAISFTMSILLLPSAYGTVGYGIESGTSLYPAIAVTEDCSCDNLITCSTCVVGSNNLGGIESSTQ